MAVIADGQGRTLSLRRLTVLDRLRLFKAAGPVLAENAPWFGMAVLAASVEAIDGVPVPLPSSEAQIEAAVVRLGEEGLSAVAEALEQRDASSIEQLAGNSRGTPT
ncbi:MAG: hypothetical protein BGO51_02115 [Rhodospirillales bacterium 69-11]|nr:hypothetical protein [Rhodospirillales bacterium]OJW25455.1 MAG: hypothetical protein BGO51_02115 [Rhodospirillales bacterium 69-11]